MHFVHHCQWQLTRFDVMIEIETAVAEFRPATGLPGLAAITDSQLQCRAARQFYCKYCSELP
jgi:hypothetical protein